MAILSNTDINAGWMVTQWRQSYRRGVHNGGTVTQRGWSHRGKVTQGKVTQGEGHIVVPQTIYT